ncbi:MAG: hypothetical protein CEO22_574 [Candidatus Berkelbacteria bacterium Gr01-1014_85]|uniref:Uncharacterized protein n=1 Tax=Candidatus Berkelbacteria bacterium Gr01-1014_85 TaxID=2017150 RepID=A0A554JA94_9BACT|nr:MAG: hypothetical protein CEO22_574 [Candidatus Berkelbacteria bacterium Gr01-1014_85]
MIKLDSFKAAWLKIASKLTEANQRQWTIVYALAMLVVCVWLVLQLSWLKQANQRFAEATSQRLSLVQVVVDYLNGRQSLDRLKNRQTLSQAWPSASERQAQVERLINELKLTIKVNPLPAAGTTTGTTAGTATTGTTAGTTTAGATTAGTTAGTTTGSTTANNETAIQLSGSQLELWQLINELTTRAELPGILSFELLAGPVPNQEQLTLHWRLGQTGQ